MNNRVAREYRANSRKVKMQNQMQRVRNIKDSKKPFFRHMEVRKTKTK